jgi:hypothetical protein
VLQALARIVRGADFRDEVVVPPEAAGLRAISRGSVYTTKGGAFSEVLVDPKTGRVAKVEAIEGGEDLTAAKAQADTMAKAKTPLGGAVDAAVKNNAGFRPVSVTPTLKDGHPVADVILMKGDELKTASERLD